MTRARIAPLLVTGLLLAGCGGSEDGGGETAATKTATPAATATAAASPAATEAAAEETAGGAAKVTPLGSTLKIGEPAVIDYTDSTTSEKSLIELTPKKIEKGTLDDFKNIDLDEDQKSSTPYYATIEVKNVGDGDLTGGSPATYINGIDDRGQDQNEIIFFGDFDRCDSEKPKSLKAGESYTACLVYLVPGGGSIKGFRWVAFDQESGKSDLNWKE